MKKILVLTAIIALAFASCDLFDFFNNNNGNDNGNTTQLPTLTISNQSSFNLTNVRFTDILFAESNSNDLPRGSPVPHRFTADQVNRAAFITFTLKDTGIECRTQRIVSVSDEIFTFLDITPVEEVGNPSNRGTLLEIASRTSISVEFGGLNVERNGIVPLGDSGVNATRSVIFTITNTGSGPLNLTGTQPVEISGAEAGVFSVVQPTSPQIAPGSSLPFTINVNPPETQVYAATVTIRSNVTGGDFVFTITTTGVIPRPVASVFFGEAEILQNGILNAGEALLNQTRNIEVLIRNTGDAILTINTAGITISGSDSTAFTIAVNPSANIPVGGDSRLFIECRPTRAGENNAILSIPTNDEFRNPLVIFLRVYARQASNEARLSSLESSIGTFDPIFHGDINNYELRIDAHVTATAVRIRPTSINPNAVIRVNGVNVDSGSMSQDFLIALNNTLTILVTAENGVTTVTYTVTIRTVRTWQRLHGTAGQRTGINRAISNGVGGIYAGGYTTGNTAAIFNIDNSGNILNNFPFQSNINTDGPRGIGSFYSVFESSTNGEYVITISSSPTAAPTIRTISLTTNNTRSYSYPQRILRSGNFYLVTGNINFRSSTDINAAWRNTPFIHRHNINNGEFVMGRPLTISPPTGILADSFTAYGMEILSSGDILLYGTARTTAAITIGFASAINISNDNLWELKWRQIYPLGNRNTAFTNHFIDNASPPNIVLLGDSEGEGFVTKFPLNVTTEAGARPPGWPKVVAGNQAKLAGGLAADDRSGYIFVGRGRGTGSHGGDDVWVVKTDIDANGIIWEQFFGGTGNDFANAIVELPDGFIIMGGTQSPIVAGQTRTGAEDMYIINMNKDGTMD